MRLIDRYILITLFTATLIGCQSIVHNYWAYDGRVFESKLGRISVSTRSTRTDLGKGRYSFTEPYTVRVGLLVKDEAGREVNIRVLSLESLGKSLIEKPLSFSGKTEDVRYRGAYSNAEYFAKIPGIYTAHEPIDVKYEISYMGVTETFESRLEPKYWESRTNIHLNYLKREFPQ